MKNKYKVVGVNPVDPEMSGIHVMPGDTFVADFTPEREAFLMQVGAIEAITSKPPKPIKDEAKE